MIKYVYRKVGIKMNDLIKNIDNLHTTKMGIERLRKLQIKTPNMVEWCKAKILDDNASIKKIGKNWYINIDNYRITVNAYSYTIITAHKIK